MAAAGETAGNNSVFENARGEFINPDLHLVTDPERGKTWAGYVRQEIPVELFTRFGLINTEGSEDWANLVEHSAYVAATAITIADQLIAAGVPVDRDVVERAAWAHDAAKRRDIAERISREAEVADDVLTVEMKSHGYSAAEIAAARNTGRLPDRFIENPIERQTTIGMRTIEENIVGYADARMRGSELMTLEGARDDSVLAKPKSEAFFNDHWYPYYRDVENRFTEVLQEAGAVPFDPSSINADTVYATVQAAVAES
jgi:hypothetical protein